jgi:hypothetical protein
MVHQDRFIGCCVDPTRGYAGRIALPVAGDDDKTKAVVMRAPQWRARPDNPSSFADPR